MEDIEKKLEKEFKRLLKDPKMDREEFNNFVSNFINYKKCVYTLNFLR